MALDLIGLIPTAISGVAGAYAMSEGIKAQEAALNAYTDASRILAKLVPPKLANMVQPYGQMVFLGQLTPEQVVADIVERSAYEGIRIPPELQQQQYEVLSKLKEIAQEGGITATERAQLEKIRGEIGAQERGARQAILQEAQRRGIGGAGVELQSRMIAQQQAANRASQMGFDVAAQAQQRALQALQQSGQLAGQMRAQTFSEQAQTAAAQDAIAKFNAQMKAAAEATNVEARNRAAAAAQQTLYDIQRFNVGQQTAEQQARQQALQQEWANLFGQTSAVAGRTAAIGDYLQPQAQMWQQMGATQLGEFGRQLPGVIKDIRKYLTPTTSVLPGGVGAVPY